MRNNARRWLSVAGFFTFQQSELAKLAVVMVLASRIAVWQDPFWDAGGLGILSLFAMQILLNVSVVTGVLPATGISLPFFSYGRTALFLQLLEMGVVLPVSGQTQQYPSPVPQVNTSHKYPHK